MTFEEQSTLLSKDESSCLPFVLLGIATDRASEVGEVGLRLLYFEPVQTRRQDTGVLSVNPLTHNIPTLLLYRLHRYYSNIVYTNQLFIEKDLPVESFQTR
jgi:hypothetical protein